MITSGLATLGSLLVALFIFGLIRWRNRRRTLKERRIDSLTRFSGSLGDLLGEVMDSTVTPAGEEKLRVATVHWISKSISFKVTHGMSPIREDFERTSNALGRWAKSSNEAFRCVRAGDTTFEQSRRPVGVVAEQLLLLQYKVNVLIYSRSDRTQGGEGGEPGGKRT